MKALCIRQPWAWAIFNSGKDIENRNYRPSITGTIAIHVPGKKDPMDRLPRGTRRPDPEELITGVFIGVVDVVEAVKNHPSKWRNKDYKYGWVLENPRLLAKPVEYKLGKTYLWDVPADIVSKINSRLSR